MFSKLNNLMEERVEIPVPTKDRNKTCACKLLGGGYQLIVIKLSLTVTDVLTRDQLPTKHQVSYPCHHIGTQADNPW